MNNDLYDNMTTEEATKMRNEAIRKGLKIDAEMNYILFQFGNVLAKREGYKELEGFDAIHFYLIEKYRWLPSQVKSMSFEDIKFLLTEEMSNK